jgi:hypothetical protein
MSEQNNSAHQFGTLYHGSSRPYKPGDIIPSRRKFGASATPDYDFAKSYANGRLVVQSQREAGYTPKVWEVEPLSPAEELTNNRFEGKEINDRRGFKVIGEAKDPNGS